MTYEFIPHTADYAMRARGADFPDLLQSALTGLIHMLADVDGLAPDTEVALEVAGDSREELLVAALKEVLYMQDDDLIAVSVRDLHEADMSARFMVAAAPLRPNRGRLAAHVKAVTYHNLQIRPCEGGLVVEVVLDT